MRNDATVAPGESSQPLPEAEFVAGMMRRQAGLSLRVAAVFVAILLGLPLFNLYLPRIANHRLGGFTLTWLFLAVLFYPVTWLLSAYFVRRSDQIEAEIAAENPHLRHAAPLATPFPEEEAAIRDEDGGTL